MGMLSKNTIKKWILPHLSVVCRGGTAKALFVELINAILYHLKMSGCRIDN